VVIKSCDKLERLQVGEGDSRQGISIPQLSAAGQGA
jgi:hypothetical protein